MSPLWVPYFCRIRGKFLSTRKLHRPIKANVVIKGVKSDAEYMLGVWTFASYETLMDSRSGSFCMRTFISCFLSSKHSYRGSKRRCRGVRSCWPLIQRRVGYSGSSHRKRELRRIISRECGYEMGSCELHLGRVLPTLSTEGLEMFLIVYLRSNTPNHALQRL